MNKEIKVLKDSKEGKKLISFFEWVLQKSPEMYEDLIKIVSFDNPKWIIIQGARYAGKTMLLVLFVVLCIITQPEGDIIILRKFKNMHKDGMFKSLQSRFIQWQMIFPVLSEFYFDRNTLLISRKLPNGREQEILLYGRDHDGIEKIKGFDFENRYVALFQMDESEDYSGIKTDYQRMEDHKDVKTIIDTIGRRVGRFKQMPPTVCMFASNPKVWNSWQHHIRNQYSVGYNLDQLRNEHFDMIYDPSYDGGNGLVFLVSTPFGIIESRKEGISLSEGDTRTVYGRERTKDESYASEVMAQPARPESSTFKTLDDFHNWLPEHVIPTSIGIDYGIGDRAVITIKGSEGIINRETRRLNVLKNGLGGAIKVNVYEGLSKRRKASLKEKIDRENYLSGELISLLENEIFINEKWMYYYANVKKLKISYGPKDDVLITEIWKLIEKEYPSYMDLLEFVAVNAYKKYNASNRVAIWDKHFVKPGKRWLIPELTPVLVQAVMDIRQKDVKTLETDSLKTLQDIWDSYMYSEMGEWDEEGILPNVDI